MLQETLEFVAGIQDSLEQFLGGSVRPMAMCQAKFDVSGKLRAAVSAMYSILSSY